VTDFLAKTGDEASFANPLEGYVDVDGSVQYHIYPTQITIDSIVSSP
jgi:hypothetical protein